LDRSVSLWDIRRMDTSRKPDPVYHLPHELAVSCAVFSTDGTQMLSNGCGPDHVKVYDVSDMMGSYEEKMMKGRQMKTLPLVTPKEKFYHNNKTGRWLTKFKPSFDPKRPNVFVMGCMDQPRCIEIYSLPSISSEKRTRPIMRLRDDLVNSVQSLNEFHQEMELIASANSSGRVSIWSLPGLRR
jgi:WD40 repeat protein